jgi:Ni/Co efflux regulator RcnB
MRKIVLTLAALAAVGFVVPMTTSAKAEDAKVVIKNRGEHRHMDRGYHRGWEHAHDKKVVVIKHGRRHHDHD